MGDYLYRFLYGDKPYWKMGGRRRLFAFLPEGFFQRTPLVELWHWAKQKDALLATLGPIVQPYGCQLSGEAPAADTANEQADLHLLTP